MSPDAFVQMAYQLAHRRAKGLTGATYESIATRQYRHGRTEAMRVVTPEVLTFVSTMEDPARGPDGQAGGVPGGGGRARRAGQGVPGRATRPSSTCGSCS